MVRIFGPTDNVVMYTSGERPGGNKIVTRITLTPGQTITVGWSLSQYVSGDGNWGIDIGSYDTAPVSGQTFVHTYDNHNGGTNTFTATVSRSDYLVNFYGPNSHGYCNQVTVDTTGSWTPPAACQYGTRPKATSPLWGAIGTVALAALTAQYDLSWFEQTIMQLALEQIDISKLCSSLPPTPPPPPPEAANYPPYKLLQWLYPIIWDTFCECTPGATTPIAPPPPNYGAGAGFQLPPTIVVNPTNPCLDITEVRQQLNRILRLMQVDVDLDQLMQRYSLPFATVRGATHSGLSGTGSFPIPRCIGVQVVVTSSTPGRQLEGAPSYIWDLGWASLMDGNGFIQERRITRQTEVWLPRGMQEATTFGYVFKDGVTADVTELYAET